MYVRHLQTYIAKLGEDIEEAKKDIARKETISEKMQEIHEVSTNSYSEQIDASEREIQTVKEVIKSKEEAKNLLLQSLKKSEELLEERISKVGEQRNKIQILTEDIDNMQLNYKQKKKNFDQLQMLYGEIKDTAESMNHSVDQDEDSQIKISIIEELQVKASNVKNGLLD